MPGMRLSLMSGMRSLTKGRWVLAASRAGMGGRRQETVCFDPERLPASAQVKKIKKMKRERRRHLSPFQQLQSKRNFWSVTHPAKVAGLSHRL